MSMLAANHPIWRILRLAVVGAIMFVLCATMYRHGFDQKDVILILTTIGGLAGYDKIKNEVTKEVV